MTFLLAGFAVAWLFGLLFLVGQYLNDILQVLNNCNPEATRNQPPQSGWLLPTVTTLPFVFSFDGFGFLAAMLLIGRLFRLNRFKILNVSSIDAAQMNAVGHAHLEAAINRERILFAWTVWGVVLLVCALIFVQAA